jgi:hypothetical protein
MSEWDRYASAVYVGVRDGAVDRTAAFDLASLVLEYYPLKEAARELAEASIADGNESRLTKAARRLLAAESFEPGFDLEPGLLTTLEEAMEAVNADMRATGLPGTGRLVVPRWEWSPYNAFVLTWAGDYGSTSGIFPQEARDPVTALAAVADHAQDALMETLGEAWPVCPAHAPAAHARVTKARRYGGATAGAAMWSRRSASGVSDGR